MTVTLSIKSVPTELASALRERARRNRRSMQGELMQILEQALRPEPLVLGPEEVLARVREARAERSASSVSTIRGDRDSR